MDVAVAPMALMSLRFWAAAFQPTSKPVVRYPLGHWSRKSWSCTWVSMLMTVRPSGAAMIAASSPGPSNVAVEWLLSSSSRGKIRASRSDSDSPATVSVFSGKGISGTPLRYSPDLTMYGARHWLDESGARGFQSPRKS